jgi:ATP-dependent DNA helicase RecG
MMFQLMRGGDKAGSGMDKIRAGWRAQHWRSSRLEESLQPDRVKLVWPMVSLIPDEVDQALRVRFGDQFAKLDKTAVQAVVTAQVEGSVTNGRMQEITGELSKDITGVLQNLVRDGLLMQQNNGAGRTTAWPRTPPNWTGDRAVARDSWSATAGGTCAKKQETASGSAQKRPSGAMRRSLAGLLSTW